MKTLPERDDNRKVVTVLLSSEPSGVRKFYYCSNCGKRVLDYYSDIRIVIPGEMREVSRPIDIACRYCKTITRIA